MTTPFLTKAERLTTHETPCSGWTCAPLSLLQQIIHMWCNHPYVSVVGISLTGCATYAFLQRAKFWRNYQELSDYCDAKYPLYSMQASVVNGLHQNIKNLRIDNAEPLKKIEKNFFKAIAAAHIDFESLAAPTPESLQKAADFLCSSYDDPGLWHMGNTQLKVQIIRKHRTISDFMTNILHKSAEAQSLLSQMKKAEKKLHAEHNVTVEQNKKEKSQNNREETKKEHIEREVKKEIQHIQYEENKTVLKKHRQSSGYKEWKKNQPRHDAEK